MKKTLMAVALAVALVFSLTPVQADTYNFGQISGDDPEAFAATWLRMDVDPVPDDKVAFKFYWADGAIAAYEALGWTSNPVITQVYVYDGGIVGDTGAISSTGDVSFSQDAPGAFPGGENVGLTANAEVYSAGADPSPAFNGVNLLPGGDSLTLTFEGDYDAAIAALNAWIGLSLAEKNALSWPNGEYLAFGLQVQNLGPTGADSAQFVPVPIPGALLLLGAGLVRLAAYARRRREDV
jgi:hypothetical protein